MKRTLILAVLAALCCPAFAAPAADKNDKRQAPANTANATANPVEAPPEYVVGASDVLTVSVWKEPELSATVQVRPDGKVSLPLLGDVQASGLTPVQLTDQLRERFKQYVEQPNVTVAVNQINSRKFFIIGEVTRAGAFPLMSNVTVLQALSQAGGFSQYADLKHIYLMRTVGGKQVKYPFNYKDAIKAKGSSKQPEMVLMPGDTIVVP